jgi:hypothetical protein
MNVSTWLGWLLVWVFWMVATHRQHPTLLMAFIVTTSLVVAYAIVATWNQRWLVPRYWHSRQWMRYALSLVVSMLIGTAVALAIIRAAYITSLGPDPDPYGACKHYAIDLFGMVVHVALSAWIANRFTRSRSAQ